MKLRSITVLFAALCSCTLSPVTPNEMIDSAALITPAYDSVTIPPNCAPLNFAINQKGDRFQVVISGTRAAQIVIDSRDGQIDIPSGKWADMLAHSAGDTLCVEIYVCHEDRWLAYRPMKIYVASTLSDNYLVYRLIAPGYTLWGNMGIYERDLRSFGERTTIDNRSSDYGCINCHTMSANRSDYMMIHLRKEHAGTIIATPRGLSKINFKNGKIWGEGVYPTWSNDGRYIAYSINTTVQNFHMTGQKQIEVSDHRSDLMIYDLQTEQIITPPSVWGNEFLETFPAWNPKGDYLYFCRATAPTDTLQGVVQRVRYDLCRASFDSSNGILGTVEVVYAASQIGRSVSQPKCSPDGRYVVFAQMDYGTFSIWHAESDLHILDLTTGTVRPLNELNSSQSESYLSFSSDGRWVVFSSRRIDGLFTRPYIAHFDPTTGVFDKPYLLPQKNPNHYLYQMESYNLPQFAIDLVDGRTIRGGINN